MNHTHRWTTLMGTEMRTIDIRRYKRERRIHRVYYWLARHRILLALMLIAVLVITLAKSHTGKSLMLAATIPTLTTHFV